MFQTLSSLQRWRLVLSGIGHRLRRLCLQYSVAMPASASQWLWRAWTLETVTASMLQSQLQWRNSILMPLIQLPMWQRRTSLQYSGQDAACLSTRGTKAGPNNKFYPLMKHAHCFVAIALLLRNGDQLKLKTRDFGTWRKRSGIMRMFKPFLSP